MIQRTIFNVYDDTPRILRLNNPPVTFDIDKTQKNRKTKLRSIVI